MKRSSILPLLMIAVSASLVCQAAEAPWQDMPTTAWKGLVKADVPALKKTMPAIVAHPEKEVAPLEIATPNACPPGLYEVRLTLRPSHIANYIAFTSGIVIHSGLSESNNISGAFFARVHEPETRRFNTVHSKPGPLTFKLTGYADNAAVEETRTASFLKQGGPKVGAALDEKADDELDLGLAPAITPETAVYYLVDKVEYRPLSLSGQVKSVEVDKIRYLPGDPLKGSAVVADVGGKGGEGMLEVILENRLKDRVTVKSIPVKLDAAPKTVPFEITLPREELGYALVAAFVSKDGADRSEAAEYFNIASNFQRVAIFGGGLATRDAVLEEEPIRRGLTEARKDYFNATEYFAWAEDDMVAMSPASNFWSSGQTNYRMHKPTLQRQIRLAHEQGLAVATYGKYIMSGGAGWETAYDYPNDHRSQYFYPVGMWEGVNVPIFDRRRSRDYRVYGNGPTMPGNAFNTWWSAFMPVNPDATPRMTRIAAEECVRSIEMFGWDAIRWDGHPRGGGQCGGSGNYDAAAARQTQALVRYFKAIVAAKQPNFRHGYNYFLIEPEKTHDWGVEDFELDELCREGGLLMNESIGNASAGWTFAQIARNLQVEGDLCRERGGYYLGICFAMTPRDMLIESALWAAAGCRPYNSAMTRETRRYCTRYSQFTFDENLRRLASPEKVLAPKTATPLWWQPFVYETPLEDGKRRLVVNLLNLPQQVKRPNNRDNKPKPEWDMPKGTDPVAFALTLPAGMRATGATLIDPQTLETSPLAVVNNTFEAPPVAIWSVVVVDLEVAPNTPALASLAGPPVTFGVPRASVKAEDRKADVVLDPSVEIWEVNKRIGDLDPEWKKKGIKEQAAMEALSGEALDKALMARRQEPDALIKTWWKGGSLPGDLALKDKPPAFGDLTPKRNGRMDIFYARGAMDYRLRMPIAFAGLNRFSVHDAPLTGVLRQSPGYYLVNGVPGRKYPEYDVLLFTGIPHAAIGAENSYALPEYIKAGGGAFFTGGEYAFGKGGYMHTVLERDLLPVVCAGDQDTVYTDKPLPFEPGPDFGELNVKLDFAAKPSFWVRNQVILKPGVKVFLKSGNRPILVGWQLGKGRVACLLVDYRGRTDKEATAFFDWEGWPTLAASVITWLAPDAGKVDAPVVLAAGDAKAIVDELKKAAFQNETEDLLADEPEKDGGLGAFDDKGSAPVSELKGEDLKKRLAMIERAFAVEGPEASTALMEQLATVGNLPPDVRLRMLDRVKKQPPATAAKLAAKCLESSESSLRGVGYWLLAMTGDPAFVKVVSAPGTIPGELDTASRERLRDLAIAVTVYPKPDLVEEGKRRVAAWNELEKAQRDRYARNNGGDVEMLETSPFLDAEALFARTAWLAYLSRYEPAAYAAPFAKQWLMQGEYQDYCSRMIESLWEDKQVSKAVAESRIHEWGIYSVRCGYLTRSLQPDMESLLAKAGVETAGGLLEARFAPEIRGAINLLGNLDRSASAGILGKLKSARETDLSSFATARAVK